MLPHKVISALLDSQFVKCLVMELLLSNVLRYCRLVRFGDRNVVFHSLELSVAELVLKIAALLEDHERAFAFEVSHEAWHTPLRSYTSLGCARGRHPSAPRLSRHSREKGR